MQWKPTGKWSARLGAFTTALLLGASAIYWVLHWPVTAAQANASGDATALVAQSAAPIADLATVAGLLGAKTASASSAGSEAPVSTSSRFKLTGVVARSNGLGSAIISVDGLPPKSYRVGSDVAGGWVLKSVGPRRAMLSSGPDGPVAQTLEIPALASPN